MSDGNKTYEDLKESYLSFINSCRVNDFEFSLTKNSDISPYALCFAIFGYNLILNKDLPDKNKYYWSQIIKNNLNDKLLLCKKNNIVILFNKPYLQLLTFSISALRILGTIDSIDLEENIPLLENRNMNQLLDNIGALEGNPGSGNFAMFYFILYFYLTKNLKYELQSQLDSWVDLHLKKINKYGFWGREKSMSHLQFQNGYHQYEIFSFLNIANNHFEKAAASVAELSDRFGHFAPYIGGGGCYDYDAIFLISSASNNTEHLDLMTKTLESIISEQNKDGGFAESLFVRPINLNYFINFFIHIKDSKGKAQRERLRQFITLLRHKHNNIKTHWSKKPRKWNESNLWDSWFRMMTIAKIDIALNKQHKNNWGFIDYPGIGYGKYH